MISSDLVKDIEQVLNNALGNKIQIERTSPLTGGDINQAYKLETSEGNYFIKWNDANLYPGMFDTEAKGLEILKKTNEIEVPIPITTGTIQNYSILILNYIESTHNQSSFWEDFGMNLAQLHKHSCESFGLDHDNYIGSLQQSNKQHDNWISFFIDERLERQVKLAKDSGLLAGSILKSFDTLYTRLPDIFPEEPPALLHGDLWSGNFMTGSKGHVVIIDPAVYYGHREMDIGMSLLFGGFQSEFYDAYNSEHPMEKGWKQRTDICNLYPLIVHVNLFGMSYVGSVQNILARFT